MLYQLETSVAPGLPSLNYALRYRIYFSCDISNLIWDDFVPAVLFVPGSPLQWRAVIASTASRAA